MLIALVCFALAVEPQWRVIAPGVEHATWPALAAELVRLDLALHRPDVVVPGAAQPRTVADVRGDAPGLVVNGGFFDTNGRSLGLRIGGGRTVIGLRPRVDWGVLVLRQGRGEIVHSRDWRPAADVLAAIQVGPRLVVDGRATALKPQMARRTAVGLDATGARLTILVTRARVSAAAVAEAMLSLGAASALMLDGGPSTQLSAAYDGWSLEVPGGYPIPDALVLRPR